jgi:glycosyltransferase involved in cell wall biosynthesis
MSSPLRFLYLTTFYPPYHFGGDATYLYRAAHALADEGHTVDVVHCVDSFHIFHPEPPEIAWPEHDRVIRHELRGFSGALSPLLAHQTGHPLLHAGRLRRIFQSKPWDVVHYHNISLLGPGILTYQPAGPHPVKLYTTHEHWLVCPMHVLWKFNSEACRQPECLRCTLRGRRPPQLWRYTGALRRAGAHIHRFLSPSRFTSAMHASRGFPYPVDTLPYFLDRTDGDWRNPPPPPHPRPYFLFVGRLERIKGLHTLIDAWQHVTGWDLLVAGTGSAEADLRRQAASNPRVRFLGSQTQKVLASLYYHAVATIVPSVTYETFGMILIESFARRTPVIVRDLGALPEVVQDSGGGFTYRDEAGLLAAVRRLAEDRALRDSLGVLGYDAFLRDWTRDAHFQRYAGHINEVRRSVYGITEECQLTSSRAARVS